MRSYTHPGATVRSSGRTRGSTPAAEKKAAQSLVAAGVDVLGQNVDSPATGQYAESQGIPWVGYDCDSSKFAPKSWLTASVYNWGLYYVKRDQGGDGRHVEAGLLLRHHQRRLHEARPVRAGRLRRRQGEDRSRSRRRSRTGPSTSSTGPLYDQSGKLRVAKGVKMQVLKGGTNSLYGMNWLVKGVIGSPKG